MSLPSPAFIERRRAELKAHPAQKGPDDIFAAADQRWLNRTPGCVEVTRTYINPACPMQSRNAGLRNGDLMRPVRLSPVIPVLAAALLANITIGLWLLT